MTTKKIKNVLLISLDTVRADVAYSGKFQQIEKLRQDGVTFLNTVSSSPLTPVSHASVFTGLQPYNHGIRHLFKEKLSKGKITLAQILKREGFQTAGIVSCPGMNGWYGLGRGFDHYDDEIPKLSDGSDPLATVDVKKRGTALKRAEIVVQRAENWLKNNKTNPFFLFLHFFDAHWPYNSPKKFAGDNVYEEEVAYSLHYLELFIDKLEKDGILQNTIIVCFSDHGEDLGGLYKNDKGGEKFGHPEEFGHGCLLYNQTQKVVLVMSGGGLPKNFNIPQQVRLIDVAPTILDLLNIESSDMKCDGVSLLPIIKGINQFDLPAYSETFYPEEQQMFPDVKNKKSIIFNNKHKIIFHLNSDVIETYDLENDPFELNNLSK